MEPVLAIMERTKLLRARDERIAALETENAILHLHLAQLRGSMQQLLKQNTQRCGMCEGYGAKISILEQQLQLLRNELGELQKLFHACYSELQNGMVTLQTIVPALLRKASQGSTEIAELQGQYRKERVRRRELHNALVELRGNIRVHCRVRPVLEFDKNLQSGQRVEECVHIRDEETAQVRQLRGSVSGPLLSEKLYEFDRVYGPSDGQEKVFSDIQPLITSLIDGYNVCLLAYGQTGSGKTHTMLGEREGPQEGQALVPGAARELFRLIREDKGSYQVHLTVAEIYNEQIRDLLSADDKAKHDITYSSSGETVLTNMTTKSVHSASEVETLVWEGMLRRAVDSTLIHQHSSRSHLIISLHLTGGVGDCPPKALPYSPQCLTPTFSEQTSRLQWHGNFRTKLQLVDLAGSECVGQSGATGAALRETQCINRSLSALSDVLGSLADRSSHIPYRNSVLTHLLQDSIGGDAKMVLFVCVSPTAQYIAESVRVLGFGSRARQVQRGQAKKHRPIKTK